MKKYIISLMIFSFTALQGYSEEDKMQARLEIHRLTIEIENRKNELREMYNNAFEQRIVMAWDDKLNSLEKKLYQQKVIAGQAMSFAKKMALGGIGVATVFIGGAFVYQYFLKKSSLSVKSLREIFSELEFPPSLSVKNLREMFSEPEFPPYESPPLVEDKGNVKELRRRSKKIKEQKYYRDSNLLWYNPNYNKADEKDNKQRERDAQAVQKRIKKEEQEQRREELYKELISR